MRFCRHKHIANNSPIGLFGRRFALSRRIAAVVLCPGCKRLKESLEASVFPCFRIVVKVRAERPGERRKICAGAD